jgi:hypothetical protein
VDLAAKNIPDPFYSAVQTDIVQHMTPPGISSNELLEGSGRTEPLTILGGYTEFFLASIVCAGRR